MATRFFDRSTGMWTWEGTDGPETINGRSDSERIFGYEGNDTLNGNDGDDRLYADGGEDVAYGGRGNDRIGLKDGDDYGNGGTGNDVMYGDDGDDFLNGAGGDDRLIAGRGDDFILDGSGNDRVELTDSSAGDYAAADEGRNVFFLDPGDTIELSFDSFDDTGMSSNVVVGKGYDIVSSIFLIAGDDSFPSDVGHELDSNRDGRIDDADRFVGIKDTPWGEGLHLDIDNLYAHRDEVTVPVGLEAILVGREDGIRVSDIQTFD